MGSAGQNGGKRRRGAVRSPQRQNESTRARTDSTGVFPAWENPHAEIHSLIWLLVSEGWANGWGGGGGEVAQALGPERAQARASGLHNQVLRT